MLSIFSSPSDNLSPFTGDIEVSSPSNIALIKYWGKREGQLPSNPSISYTLTQCHTKTRLKVVSKQNSIDYDVRIYLDNVETVAFKKKIITFFDRIIRYAPYLKYYTITIYTHNTFPHSSGIASSASGMSALALALVKWEQKMGIDYTEDQILQRASFMARLGSGSACRSLYQGLVLWGEHPAIDKSSDLYAIPLQQDNIHYYFRDFHDSILLIDHAKKSVSSSQGHSLMHNHPYARKRFSEAFDNILRLKDILSNGDLEAFGQLIEHEALSLHAMMMTSIPYFILMEPATVAVIHKLWDFRKATQTPIFFTLDAGANVHLLYPHFSQAVCRSFIDTELVSFCQEKCIIHDRITF